MFIDCSTYLLILVSMSLFHMLFISVLVERGKKRLSTVHLVYKLLSTNDNITSSALLFMLRKLKLRLPFGSCVVLYRGTTPRMKGRSSKPHVSRSKERVVV